MGTSAIGTTTVSTTTSTSHVRHHHHGARASMPDPKPLLDGQQVDGIDLSDPGQLFQQLQQLQQQKPDQLATVLTDIADKLRSVAGGTSATSAVTPDGAAAGADFLNRLADRFDAAAQSGDLASLVSPGAPNGAGHGSRAEQAYRSAERGADGSLHALFQGGSDADTSSADVQQQIAELRAQIATLMAKSGTTTTAA
jgi:hypothetical protein